MRVCASVDETPVIERDNSCEVVGAVRIGIVVLVAEVSTSVVVLVGGWRVVV